VVRTEQRIRLDHVFDIELAYTTEFLLVQPFGGEEGWATAKAKAPCATATR
jgi:hypothetical protein